MKRKKEFIKESCFNCSLISIEQRRIFKVLPNKRKIKMEKLKIKAGDISISNPIALSAMAGMTDSRFAIKNAKNAGLVILGAYNLDAESKAAGLEVSARGRKEFNPEGDIFEAIEKEIEAVHENMPETTVAVSVRSAEIEPLLKAAKLLKEKNAIMELDAHCRQPEFTERGMGQSLLLKNAQTLPEMIQKIKQTGVVLSVKFRTSQVDPIAATEFLDAAGADIIHADAMIEGKGADHEAILEIRNATRKVVIANNSVDDFESALEFFMCGADLVSIARATVEDAELIPLLAKQISEYQQETGWYNAPKHICKRGDNRGLAFCCPPVKNCSLIKKIESVGFTRDEFIQLKQESARGTPLELGPNTCFGSLVWCCKATKACYYRDDTLKHLGLSREDYMALKRELSEKILNAIEEKKAASN